MKIRALLIAVLVGITFANSTMVHAAKHKGKHKQKATPTATAMAGQPPSTPASSGSDTVVVDPNKVIRTIPETFYGVNYFAFYDKAQQSAASAKAISRTPIRAMRFPGGVVADYYDWANPTFKGKPVASPAEGWKYAREFGAKLMVLETNFKNGGKAGGVNIGQPIGKPYKANDPQNSAAWVTYNKQNNIPAMMEVGNEEDIKLYRKKNDPKYQAYIDGFNAQARAMHAADPNVKVIGPVGVNEYQWWGLGELSDFLHASGNKTGTGQADGVSLHFYGGVSWFNSRAVPQHWTGRIWPAIQKMIKANDTRNLPVYITEWNIGKSDVHNQFTPTLGHALLTADMVGAFARSGVAGQYYWTIHYAYGWGFLYGEKDKRPVDSPTPTYYALALWGHMGDQVVSSQQTDDATSALSTYVTTRKDGAMQVMAINKLNTPRKVNVEIQGATPNGHKLTVYSLTGTTNSVDALDASYDGKTMPSPQQPLPGGQDGGVVHGKTLTYTVPAYSAVVLDLNGTTRDSSVHWSPVQQAPEAPKPTVDVAVTVARDAVSAGDTQTITAHISSNTDVGPAIVTMPVKDSSGRKISGKKDRITISAGQTVTVTETFTIPSGAYGGTYKVRVDVYAPAYAATYGKLKKPATFTVSGPPPPKISSTGSVSSSTVKSGDSVTFTAVVSAQNAAASDLLIDVEVWPATSGPKLCKKFENHINIPANGSVSFAAQCTVPAGLASGKYLMKIGVFGSKWAPLYSWNNKAATLTVG